MTKLNILLLIMLFSLSAHGQFLDSKVKRISLITKFFQIKDETNYGKIFAAGKVSLEYSNTVRRKSKTIAFNSSIGIGIGNGVEYMFKPVDIFYGFDLNLNSAKQLTVGPYFESNFFWQMYIPFQNVKMRWLTTFEIGPQFSFLMHCSSRIIKIEFSNSLAGFSSRPSLEREKHFYTMRFGDFVKNANSNLKFGSLNLFNHAQLSATIINIPGKKLSLMYKLEYIGYYEEPRLANVGHSFGMIWQLEKSD